MYSRFRLLTFAATSVFLLLPAKAGPSQTTLERLLSAMRTTRAQVAPLLADDFVMTNLVTGEKRTKSDLLASLDTEWAVGMVRQASDIQETAGVVTAVITERSQLHTLLGHPGDRVRVSWRLRGGRLASAQVEPLGAGLAAGPQLTAFLTWARSAHADELGDIEPTAVGKLEPSRAKRLIELAKEYNAAQGGGSPG